jgi:regulator of RNase E activity RraA
MPSDHDPILARYATVGTSMVTDSFLRLGMSGWMEDVLPIRPGLKIAARARTLTFRPVRRDGVPASSMYSYISRVAPGEVLVMGTGGTTDNLMGCNMTTFAKRSGLAGIVTDSRTRDRAEIGELGFPMFSRGAAVRPPTSVEVYELDVAVTCGGAQVQPGDIVIADDDGVVVVPAHRAEDVLYQIEDIAEIEAQMVAAIARGAGVSQIEAVAGLKKNLRASR